MRSFENNLMIWISRKRVLIDAIICYDVSSKLITWFLNILQGRFVISSIDKFTADELCSYSKESH